MESQELIKEHKKVLSQLRWVWRLGPVLVAALLVGNVYGMVNRVQDFDSEKFATHLESEARDAWPSLEFRLRAIGDELRPKMEATILLESERLGDDVSKRLEEELESFRTKGDEILAEELQKALSAENLKHHQLISKHIPELKGDEKARERVIAHVNAAAAAWGVKQFRTLFTEHIQALESIRKTLDANYVNPNGDGAAANADELVLIWLELFEVTVADDSTILGEEKSDVKADAPSKEKGE